MNTSGALVGHNEIIKTEIVNGASVTTKEIVREYVIEEPPLISPVVTTSTRVIEKVTVLKEEPVPTPTPLTTISQRVIEKVTVLEDTPAPTLPQNNVT